MRRNIIWKSGILAVAMTCVFTDCSPRQLPASALMGDYIYKYTDGEVEVLILNADATYDHFLYKSVENAKNNINPEYRFRGNWSSNNGTVDLATWMLLADYSHLEKPLNRPIPCTSLRGYWYNHGDPERVGLLVSEDMGYNFLKIAGREQIK
jgi:hypothetical protein